MKVFCTIHPRFANNSHDVIKLTKNNINATERVLKVEKYVNKQTSYTTFEKHTHMRKLYSTEKDQSVIQRSTARMQRSPCLLTITTTESLGDHFCGDRIG
uniref:Uncharacterized protein n=1 Tax=Cacopsylla melanoneura TaxID=428564 RepID=A0A8D8RN48_9HEMI